MSDDRFTLVLVDDSDVDAEMIARWVRRSPWEVDVIRFGTCEEGQIFLDNALQSRQRIDLVIVDLSLPGCDGRSLLSQVKARPELQHLPVVVLTSSARDDDVRDCYARGANGYVTKPVDASRFQERLDTILRYWIQHAPRVGVSSVG